MSGVLRLGPFSLLAFACASSTPSTLDEADQEGLPFVKLATRGMAAIVHWRGAPPAPALQGELEESLSKRLGQSYATEVEVHRRTGPFEGFDADTLARMVEREVDDVIVLEVESKEAKPTVGEDGPIATSNRVFDGVLKIVTLADDRVVAQAKVSGKSAADGRGSSYADRVWLEVLKRFNDPGRYPELDDLAAANRLADKNHCDLAIRLYQRSLAASSASSVAEATKYHGARDKLARCERMIAFRDATEKDAKATFKLTPEFESVATRVQDAFRHAIPTSGLTEELLKLTDKPAVLRVLSGVMRIEMRYHPERYNEAISGRPRYVRGQPLIYFDVYERIMLTALNAKTNAAQDLPPYDQAGLKEFRTVLRLSTLIGDYIELEFGDTRSQIAIADELRIHSVGFQDTIVKASAPQELREMIFTLGPPEMMDGKLTEYGLVLKFLEVRP
ncbi:MAG: hypothetical protein HY791_06090 [Deltaproteobacteria bacterium]|nr:hypothetical protein [Deltaproteobacteria bacterium]